LLGSLMVDASVRQHVQCRVAAWMHWTLA